MKELKGYIYLYLGCECKVFFGGIEIANDNVRFELLMYSHFKLKPILRPLSEITEDEKLLYYDEFLKDSSDTTCRYSNIHKCNYSDLHLKDYKFEPKTTIWLLKKGFDLFGLIESGLAIDKSLSSSSVARG